MISAADNNGTAMSGIRISLVVQGSLDCLESVSKLLGAQPSKVRENPTEKGGGLCTWIFRAPEPVATSSLSQQWSVLQESVVSIKRALAELSDELTVYLSCAVSFDEHAPPVYFPKELIKIIASIDAAIDVDVYVIRGQSSANAVESKDVVR